MLSPSNLHAWQVESIARGSEERHGACLLVGGGKTVVGLSVANHWLEANPGKSRVLLVAPRPVLDSTWISEPKKWSHLSHLTVDSAHSLPPSERRAAWLDGSSHITTCTPDLLHDLLAFLRENESKHGIVGIIVDESHLFKNFGSRRSKALQVLTNNDSNRVLFLSGTPNPNGTQDLWLPGSILSKRDEFWGANPYKFLNSHFTQVNDFVWRPRSGSTELITREFAKHAISIGCERIPGVLEPVRKTVHFSHTPELHKVMGEFEIFGEVTIDGKLHSADGDASHLARLHQLTQGFLYDDSKSVRIISQKRVEALAEIVRSVDSPVLVGVKFLADVEMIKSAIPDAVSFNGQTANPERTKIIADWNANKIRVLVGSPAAMGTGLNLQHSDCQDLVWYTHPWDAAAKIQFEGRLVRQGQKHTIRIHELCSSHGIDAAILSTLARKESGATALMRAIKHETQP